MVFGRSWWWSHFSRLTFLLILLCLYVDLSSKVYIAFTLIFLFVILIDILHEIERLLFVTIIGCRKRNVFYIQRIRYWSMCVPPAA